MPIGDGRGTRLNLMQSKAFLLFICCCLIGPVSPRAVSVENGTAKEACGPSGGPAFTIDLEDSAITATVLASLPMLEKEGIPARFKSRDEDGAEDGQAFFLKCDEKKKNCKDAKGSIAITTILDGQVTGTIQFPGIGWGRGVGTVEEHFFRVQYDRQHKANCS